MSDISIKFVNFWPTFDIHDNKFVKALNSRHNVTVIPVESSDTPDILFYSRCGVPVHYDYDCVKVYFTGENDVPDFNECDYALSFHDIDFNGHSLRYPLYMLYEYGQCFNPPALTDRQALDRGFCSLLMRNSNNCDPRRLEIINAVDAYRPIAYGGPFRNNVGGPVEEKIPFIAKYKFNLALENTDIEGYVTEKLLEALAAATVPVYWGPTAAAIDFNPDAYINVNDYNSLDSMIADLAAIDADPGRYLSILRAPNFGADGPIDFDGRLADFLCVIADNPVRRVARYGETAMLHRRNRLTGPLWARRTSRAGLRVMSSIFCRKH